MNKAKVGIAASSVLYWSNKRRHKASKGQITYVNNSDYVKGQTIGGFRTSAGDEPYIKFKFNSGNLHSGTITLYGIKDA